MLWPGASLVEARLIQVQMKQKRVLGFAGGAVGLGGVAAALAGCCAAPWAVAVLGVTGAVMLARFASYQPYILAAAGLLLAVAFYWAYRPDPACTDGSCEARSRRRLRWAVWAAAFVLTGLAMLTQYPWY